ncbi:MAG: glycosyltransferase family 2 protein [Sedimentisphaerales bacterium]
MEFLDVSIIIVNWNTRDILRGCLWSVYEQTQDISFEVIVVDNASTDGSVEMVKRDFPQAVLIENMGNRGFAAANNQGLKITKGQYILLLNSDTIVLDGAIQKTVVFAEQHPEAAVIGCKALNPDGSLQPTCFMFPSLINMFLSSTYLYELFPRDRFFGRERMTWWDRNDVREVDVVTGCFMLVRRRAIEQTGLMDEQFFVYGEETDWCYRFRQGGWKVLFIPDAKIVHLGGQSSKQMASQMTLQLKGSILQFMRKHHSFLEYSIACILVWLFFTIRVPWWFIKYIFARTQKDYCRMKMLTYLTGMKKLLFEGGRGLSVKPGS